MCIIANNQRRSVDNICTANLSPSLCFNTEFNDLSCVNFGSKICDVFIITQHINVCPLITLVKSSYWRIVTWFLKHVGTSEFINALYLIYIYITRLWISLSAYTYHKGLTCSPNKLLTINASTMFAYLFFNKFYFKYPKWSDQPQYKMTL